RDAAEPECLHIAAKERARLRRVVDKQSETRSARDSFKAERPGAGEEVEHARVRDRIAVGVRQDVEQRLAQPVGGRADGRRFRCRERATAEGSADDAHYLVLTGRAGGMEKSAPASMDSRSPSWSRKVRVPTSSTAPAGNSPSWNGP